MSWSIPPKLASGYDIHSLPWLLRWPIEIDGLPGFSELRNGGFFHGKLQQIYNQMVF